MKIAITLTVTAGVAFVACGENTEPEPEMLSLDEAISLSQYLTEIPEVRAIGQTITKECEHGGSSTTTLSVVADTIIATGVAVMSLAGCGISVTSDILTGDSDKVTLIIIVSSESNQNQIYYESTLSGAIMYERENKARGECTLDIELAKSMVTIDDNGDDRIDGDFAGNWCGHDAKIDANRILDI